MATIATGVDTITRGVVWAALQSIAEEGGTALRKTAYSQAVREGRDFSVALFDAHGQMIAQGDFSPGHLGSMPSIVRHVIMKLSCRRSFVPMMTLSTARVSSSMWIGSEVPS